LKREKAVADMRRMPIGIQTFENIITDGYAYVDKTAWVYELANEGVYFFLGRPRRFGKSLLVSTLSAYFEGKQELFKGLAAEKLEKDWISYPVLHIDLNVTAYRNVDDLESGLDANLRRLEKVWNAGGQTAGKTTYVRFYDLIQTACEKSGHKVVVLRRVRQAADSDDGAGQGERRDQERAQRLLRRTQERRQVASFRAADGRNEVLQSQCVQRFEHA
jgi:hypothetical protein